MESKKRKSQESRRREAEITEEAKGTEEAKRMEAAEEQKKQRKWEEAKVENTLGLGKLPSTSILLICWSQHAAEQSDH
ncbi:hypothetical protein F8M41_017893 [Gigaspora margarita]|uniref:Uncharacterized protein n=1 Tax=Gigaspora margarita TaxID=4874 RepID=A0A8H4ELT4_GIGMA|nr:hypothetical protein F8M41_017893 [Gigaspora margarita]